MPSMSAFPDICVEWDCLPKKRRCDTQCLEQGSGGASVLHGQSPDKDVPPAKRARLRVQQNTAPMKDVISTDCATQDCQSSVKSPDEYAEQMLADMDVTDELGKDQDDVCTLPQNALTTYAPLFTKREDVLLHVCKELAQSGVFFTDMDRLRDRISQLTDEQWESLCRAYRFARNQGSWAQKVDHGPRPVSQGLLCSDDAPSVCMVEDITDFPEDVLPVVIVEDVQGAEERLWSPPLVEDAPEGVSMDIDMANTDI